MFFLLASRVVAHVQYTARLIAVLLHVSWNIFLDINLCIIWDIVEVKEKIQDNRYNTCKTQSHLLQEKKHCWLTL